jgi:thiamine phosphate synthase YjbQ (UPF0047 family)
LYIGKPFQEQNQIEQGGPTLDFKITNSRITFSTSGEIEFIDLSDKIRRAVADTKVIEGLVHVIAPHATGFLILTENYQSPTK